MNKNNNSYIKQNYNPLGLLKGTKLVDIELKNDNEKTTEPLEKNQEENKIVHNWVLAKKDNQEPDIIAVGLGSWRKLKSLNNTNLLNGNTAQRVLDIGSSYQSARSLKANVSIGISTSPDLDNINEENLQILSNEIDKYFLNKKIGTLSESDNKNLERIFRKTRKFSVIQHNIIADDEYTSLPISKPFFEEKQIPTEREFKEGAKKLKVSGNFSSLGAAQNELARRYGFKEYRAIKSRFVESFKSYDNINTVLIHTYKLNEIEHSEINDFFFKFRHIFRKLNFAIGILNQGNILENVEPRLYEKKLESLHIHENTMMQIYSYFLTENSIIFGQIKRNIHKLSQDEKIDILKDLESLEIDKKDKTVFGLFVGLLEYHIGKSAGDVTLVKNEDGSIGKIFKPKSDVDTKVENAVNEILNRNRMQIGSDSTSIKVSQKDLLDTLNISQSDEKKDRLSKQNEKILKEFGFELNNDAVYNNGIGDLE